jgi:hypothetical protein
MDRAVAAGIEPGVREHVDNHVHAHLDVFVDGVPVEIPAGIGIDITNPEVKRFEDSRGVSYAGIELCDSPCISSLHTHDTTGIIHTESPLAEPHTLGEFFIEWGVRLDDGCVGDFCSPKPVAVYVAGEEYTGDPREIELADLLQIAIVIGTPPAEIPATADFSNA